MTRFRPLAGATAAALAAAFALPATAQTLDPSPSLAEIFAPNRIATFFANTGIAALRTRMELEYTHMTTDILRGTVALSGVTIRPQFWWDSAGQCEITADRVTLSSDMRRAVEDVSDLTLDLIGMRMTLACFERDVAMGLRGAGFSDLTLDQGRVRVGYVYRTGETTADLTLAVNNFATLDVSASGTILPRIGPYGFPDDPAVRVSRAVVTLQDNGAWGALSAMLPGNLRNPAAVREMGTESLTLFLSDYGFRSLSAVERNFVAQLMAEVERFVTDPGEITIEAALPPGGVVIEPETYDNPAELIAALALQAREVPLARTGLVPASAMRTETMSDAEKVALAARMIEGDGIPRAPALVPELLADVLTGTGPEAAAAATLVARALEDRDPGQAYRLALSGAANNAPGAVAQLDRLEARMGTLEVLAAQRDFSAPGGELTYSYSSDGTDPRELRGLALAHLTGKGAARSYELAYVYALLADAAGDVGAAPLIAEIEARFDGRGDEVAEAWRELSFELQADAVTLWMLSDLGTRYGRD
ncbi:MAG: hypothetical protein JJT81_11695 [Rubellimicrobium sp.]|nr:hypothetical protein [Rubellimicrobium sp.]